MMMAGPLTPHEIVVDRLVSEALKLLSQASPHSIKVIFTNFLSLKGHPLSLLTQNKLINGLMQWTHPGGPWFAPRCIRRQALNTCGELFPQGHLTRKLVNYCFRVLHPHSLL